MIYLEANLTLGMEKHCKILSYRTDIPDLLNAMDCFVLPSMYEGLPVVLIEAQKMQVPCIVSASVTEAVRISNLIKTVDLKSGVKVWAEEIENSTVDDVRYDGLEVWDMNNVVKQLEEMYECGERG